MSKQVVVEWDCTELNNILAFHFISECPTFKRNYPADEGSAVLYAINSYMVEKHIHKGLLQYPDEKGMLIPCLIPITENLSLEVTAYSDLCEPFNLDVGVQIDRFVITGDATKADVDQLITFLHECHIK